jgi:hypothetical protein
MTNQIQSLRVEFKNGDLLVLVLKESTFAGYKPALLWELSYNEKCEGIADWQDGEPTAPYFVAHQTEYFPEISSSVARSAFNTRLSCSNPRNESDMGFCLNEILTPITPP